ncbi:unnamed protein product [Moneuplotes crassus]|uniref:Uncharacterized protein n=1 Tax=Euplotes crassus TaxID=5936 RepID=A0AAD1Y3W5_EUPCR|nr:unnamed protein product [Moneuplotes crassus]
MGKLICNKRSFRALSLYNSCEIITPLDSLTHPCIDNQIDFNKIKREYDNYSHQTLYKPAHLISNSRPILNIRIEDSSRKTSEEEALNMENCTEIFGNLANKRPDLKLKPRVVIFHHNCNRRVNTCSLNQDLVGTMVTINLESFQIFNPLIRSSHKSDSSSKSPYSQKSLAKNSNEMSSVFKNLKKCQPANFAKSCYNGRGLWMSPPGRKHQHSVDSSIGVRKSKDLININTMHIKSNEILDKSCKPLRIPSIASIKPSRKISKVIPEEEKVSKGEIAERLKKGIREYREKARNFKSTSLTQESGN